MRKSDIKKILHFAKNNKVVQALMVVFLILMMPGMVNGQTNPIISCSNTTCYDDGNNDGSILVTITTGTTGQYRYSITSDGTNYTYYPIDGTSWTPESSHPFTNLSPDTYTITVIDNSTGSTTSPDITIVQPAAALSWNSDGVNWTCQGVNPCTGSRPTLSGGTPNYTYIVTQGASTIDPSNHLNLCAGTYAISGTDVNGCYLGLPEPFTIVDDNEAPINCTFPEDWFRTSDQFNTLITTPPLPSATTVPYIRALDGIALNYNYTNNADPTPDVNASVSFGINADNFTNIEFRVTATPNGSTWTTNDYLRVYICYDTIPTPTWIPTPILDDNCEWNTSDCDGTITPGNEQTAWIPLPTDNKRKFWIRIDCNTDDVAKSYTGISIEFQGINIQNFLNSLTGTPINCYDLDQSIDYNPANDVHIVWRCYDTPEFSYTRRWAPRDDCGHTVNPAVPQKIMVGNPPTIEGTPLPSLTFDYCHNLDVDITAPTADDDCDDTPVISWRIFDTESTPNEIGQGTGNIVDFDFPNNHYPPDYTGMLSEERFTIYWVATDDAGITSNPVAQTVIFLPEIVVSILPDISDVDLCSEEEVTFTINATGGTNLFDIGNITVLPAPSCPSCWTWTANSGGYTTNLLTTAAPNITVTITDSNNPPIIGGCPPFGGVGNNITFPTAGTPEYTVHPKITTGTITRTP